MVQTLVVVANKQKVCIKFLLFYLIIIKRHILPIHFGVEANTGENISKNYTSSMAKLLLGLNDKQILIKSLMEAIHKTQTKEVTFHCLY